MKKEPFRSSLEVAAMLALDRAQTSMAWALLGMIVALPNRDALSKDDHTWELKAAERIAKQLEMLTGTTAPVAYVRKMAEVQADSFRKAEVVAPESRKPCAACNGLREVHGVPCTACKATGLRWDS
jgi:hypothetical protein